METIKISLPETKQVVSFKKFLTTGQSRELQKIVASHAKISSGDKAIRDIPVEAVFEMQDKAAELLIVGVFENESSTEEKAYTKEWLDNLPVIDGNLVYETINKISEGSKMTEDAKKNS